MANGGADLDEDTRVAAETVARMRTIGCAFSFSWLPGAAQSTFSLAEDEVEMGMGILGEPGIWRDKIKSADEITDEVIDRLLKETPEDADGRVTVLINSLGATSLEELYFVYHRAKQRLESDGR